MANGTENDNSYLTSLFQIEYIKIVKFVVNRYEQISGVDENFSFETC